MMTSKTNDFQIIISFSSYYYYMERMILLKDLKFCWI